MTVYLVVPDDYPDIQSAIMAIPSSEAGDILVKEGLYDLNLVFKWPPNHITMRSNLTIHGEGIDRTIIRFAPTPELATRMRYDVITSINDVSNFTLENLTVIQNGVPDNAGSSAIYNRGSTSSSNITIRQVKVPDVFGAGIAIHDCTKLLIENCQVDRVWTGISFSTCDGVEIRGNTVTNTNGNGIFPQKTDKNVVIENNVVKSVGDTSIDVTAYADSPAHENIKVLNNQIEKGHIRVTHANNILISGNTLEGASIDVDGGGGVPTNVTVEENTLNCNRLRAIDFFAAKDCVCRKNTIRMTEPFEVGTQSGIVAVLYGTGQIIEDNTIIGARDHGIDFGGWGATSQDLTIRNNNIEDFGNVGIHDSGATHSGIKIIGNRITSKLATARWTVLTDAPNAWLIQDNVLCLRGEVGGDASVSAPYATLLDNKGCGIFNLQIISSPTLAIEFTIDGQNVQIPFNQDLPEGTYEIVMPANTTTGYAFVSWSDGNANPQKTVNLAANTSLIAIYRFVTPIEKGTIDVHAYVNSEEVNATLQIVGGETFTTPTLIQVDPGSYTLQCSYQGTQDTKTVRITDSETIRIDFRLPKAPPALSPWLIGLLVVGGLTTAGYLMLKGGKK